VTVVVTWLDSLFEKDKLKRKAKMSMNVKNIKTVLGTL
jgi:hypothetical protein